MTDEILSTLHRYNIDPNNIRGQQYGGTPATSGGKKFNSV